MSWKILDQTSADNGWMTFERKSKAKGIKQKKRLKVISMHSGTNRAERRK